MTDPTTQTETIAVQVEKALSELTETANLGKGQIVVLGVSTSEVQGRHIGTSGTEEVARALYEGVTRVRNRSGFDVVWQCCEHLNRALVTERSLAAARGWTIVSAVPVPKAGGSMAAYAYRQLSEPCLVESVSVDAGVDIGETLIGMHLRPVAVPVRPSGRWIGEARVAMAYARPRLIGGERAVYVRPPEPVTDAQPSNTCD